MSFTVVIPARFASTRLPGKPLLEIAGRPMLRHVYERACACAAGRVVIATDDERIRSAAEAFGAEVCMTSAEHPSGTDRLQEAVAALGLPEELVNLAWDSAGVTTGPVTVPLLLALGVGLGEAVGAAEGFGILKAKKEFNMDLSQISHIWQNGSVVRSWLLDLAANALDEDTELKDIKPWVADSGEGRWTVFESIDLDVPAPIITLALQMRFASRDEENYPARMLAALRNQFGGHAIKKAE